MIKLNKPSCRYLPWLIEPEGPEGPEGPRGKKGEDGIRYDKIKAGEAQRAKEARFICDGKYFLFNCIGPQISNYDVTNSGTIIKIELEYLNIIFLQTSFRLLLIFN